MKVGHSRRPTAVVSLAFLTLCFFSTVTAQTPEVAITVTVEREVVRLDQDGRSVTEREPVDVARPGDVLVYTLRAVNQGVAPALGTRVVDPIPRGTVLLIEQLPAVGAPDRASLDGGRSWQDFPARVQQLDASGRPRVVAAPAEAYTHLRWDLPAPLAPGETHDVMFKVRVN